MDYVGLGASVLILIGGYFLARNFFFKKKTAIDLGVSRVCGDIDEENLKLPMVQFFLKARRDSIIGFSLIVTGIAIQIYFIVSHG
jgi:hypothetical protein